MLRRVIATNPFIGLTTFVSAMMTSSSFSTIALAARSSNNSSPTSPPPCVYSLSTDGQAASTETTKTRPPPETPQSYKLLNKEVLSHDSYRLIFGIPTPSTLGVDATIPTCIKVTMPANTIVDGYNDNQILTNEPKSKSYSPISHPNTLNQFELVVKSYPYRLGGGVATYINSLTEGQSLQASVKSPRMVHDSPIMLDRWNHVGLIAGGTGIAPLLQLTRLFLQDSDTTKVSLLYMNKAKEDVLLKNDLDDLVGKYEGRFQVVYSLTQEEEKEGYEYGRGSLEMVQKALPSPSLDGVMIFICGTDGFVSYWGGPVGRAPSSGGKKGKKIQGPLLGLLQTAGYNETQVFKY